MLFITEKIYFFINYRQRTSRFSVRLSDYFLNPAPQNRRFPCTVHNSNPASRSLLTLNSRIRTLNKPNPGSRKNLLETLYKLSGCRTFLDRDSDRHSGTADTLSPESFALLNAEEPFSWLKFISTRYKRNTIKFSRNIHNLQAYPG